MKPAILLFSLLAPVVTLAQSPQPAAPVSAPVLGRLFFTPEQRDQLDLLRLKKVSAAQSKDEPPPEIVTYEGIVRRSDGGTTVWVNSKALTERELREAQAISGRVERDGRLLLRTGQGAAQAQLRLKVGQRAELSSGKVEERPATDTRSTIAGQRRPGTDPKPGDGDPKPISAARGPIPEKLPVLDESDQVKYVPLDPAMAAKLRAAQDASRDRPN
jgi:hypothetical protein